MNIFLTGGEGFIGRNIKESYLSGKHKIYSPSISDLDLQDENSVRNYILSNKIDIVIHSAAKAGHRNAPDPTGIFFYNTRMFFSLARNIDYIKKMIVLGSGAVYDQRHYRERMNEEYSDSNLPLDEHGLCKYVIDKSLAGFNSKIIDLRIFGIFGKYEDYAIRFISNMCCKAILDINLTMNQNRLFSYLYVDDLIPVLDFFMENNPAHEIYNVTPDNSYELYNLAEKVIEISGKKLDIICKQEGMGSSYTGDNNRLKNEFKNIIFTDIDKAIADLYKWYYDNRAILNKDVFINDR